MIYMLQVYLLVAVPVFALAGLLTLTLFIWTKLQDYMRAQRAMRQIVHAAPGSLRDLPAIDNFHGSRTLGAA